MGLWKMTGGLGEKKKKANFEEWKITTPNVKLVD